MGGDKPRSETLEENPEDLSIDRPRLTPQGRADPDEDGEGEGSTNPMGEGAKAGQGSKAEG